MRSQLFLLMCLCCTLAATEWSDKGKPSPPHPEPPKHDGDKEKQLHQIKNILQENSDSLNGLQRQAKHIEHDQKTIDQKIRLQNEKLKGIELLEVGISKLQANAEVTFQLTAKGIKELTTNIKETQGKTDKALDGVSKGQHDVKKTLDGMAASQNKFERNLDGVAKSIDEHLVEVQKLIKRSVVGELDELDKTSKKMEQSQKNIEQSVKSLTELNKQSAIIKSRVEELDISVRSLNDTQDERLSIIGAVVHDLQSTNGQIDAKLCQLLSNQKQIENTLGNCQKGHPHIVGPHVPGPRPRPRPRPGGRPGKPPKPYSITEETEDTNPGYISAFP